MVITTHTLNKRLIGAAIPASGFGALGIPRRTRYAVVMLAALCSFSASMWAADNEARALPAGDQARIHGVIIARDAGKIQVREDANTTVIVVTDNNTHITMKSGLFRMVHKVMEPEQLLPGLYIEAEGHGNHRGELLASKIVFEPGDFRSARTADARVRPVESRTGVLENRETSLEGRAGELETKTGELDKRSTTLEGKQAETTQQVAAVKETAGQANDAAQRANAGVASLGDRIANLDDYEVKSTETVLFGLNSARLTPKAKADLDGLAQALTTEKGYMIEVAGFADATGRADRNQALSEQRAASVVRYLQEQENVPLRRILAPAGLGTSHAVADNHSLQGRQQNRRVEVRVLVNRGLNASGQPTQSSNAATGTVAQVAGARKF